MFLLRTFLFRVTLGVFFKELFKIIFTSIIEYMQRVILFFFKQILILFIYNQACLALIVYNVNFSVSCLSYICNKLFNGLDLQKFILILLVYANCEIICSSFNLCLNLIFNYPFLSLIFTLYICMYINCIDKNFKTKYPNIYVILLCLCSIIIITIIVYYIIGIVGKLLKWYILNTGAGGNSSGKGGFGGTSNSSGGGGSGGSKGDGSSNNLPNKGKKKEKPNLTIKTKPETPLEKDTRKVGMCEHNQYGTFQAGNMDDVNDTYCDMVNTPNTQHKAFDGVYDNAILCNDCHAIICKNCVQNYSSDEEQ